MNKNELSKNKSAYLSMFIIIGIIAIASISVIAIALINNPFLKMGEIDMNNLCTVSPKKSFIVSDTSLHPNDAQQQVSHSDSNLIYPEYPYFIEVDKTNQIITIYTTSSSGKYDKVVRYMLCSTAQNPTKFPEGYWKLKSDRSNSKRIWRTMLSHGKPLYAQYATQITGDFLFHSVPYTDTQKGALDIKRYKKLGIADSGGCIRLTVENAKWICENCKAGTTVHVVAKKKNPQLTEALKAQLPMPDSSGWDPTDPDPKNPNYHSQYTEPDPQPEGYVKANFDKITYSKEIPYVS